MNLYKRVVNAVSNVVYKKIIKRGKSAAPDSTKLTAWLIKHGLRDMTLRNTNEKVRDDLLKVIRNK